MLCKDVIGRVYRAGDILVFVPQIDEDGSRRLAFGVFHKNIGEAPEYGCGTFYNCATGREEHWDTDTFQTCSKHVERSEIPGRTFERLKLRERIDESTEVS